MEITIDIDYVLLTIVVSVHLILLFFALSYMYSWVEILFLAPLLCTGLSMSWSNFKKICLAAATTQNNFILTKLEKSRLSAIYMLIMSVIGIPIVLYFTDHGMSWLVTFGVGSLHAVVKLFIYKKYFKEL